MMNNSPPLPEEALEQFLRYCHTRRYQNKELIIKPGDPGNILYYVIEGSVGIHMENPDPEGNSIVLSYINKGEFIGEIGVFLGGTTRTVSATTRQQCVLAEISYERLHGLLTRELAPYSVDILCALGRQLSNRLLKTSRKVGQLAFLDVTGRIAKTLIELCKEPDAMTHPDGMQIRITRQEIGRIVGCSREMAGRVLKQLEGEGILSAKGKTIVVHDAR